MTNKVLKWFRISGIAICVGVALVQFVYAVLWAINNGNNIQDFYDTYIYIASAKTFASDGWRLIGYSIYVRLFMILEFIFGKNYVLLIYISQLIISMFSYAYGCKTLVKIMFEKNINLKWMLIPAVYILTIPVVWQMQFAILPDAICVASIVWMFSLLGECLWNSKGFMCKIIIVVGALLLLTGFMHRHYFYAGIALVAVILVIFILRMCKKKNRNKKAVRTMLALIICILFTSVISNVGNSMIPKVGEYVEYSLSVDLWKRFLYPNLYENYPYYADGITSVLPENVAKECDEHYEYYMNDMGPMIADMFPEKAESVYWELTKSGFVLNKGAIIKRTVKESIAYAFMPLAMEKYMYSNGISLYGYNLTRMYEKCPKLTSDYMHIGMNGFLGISVIGVLMYILETIVNKEQSRKNILCLLYCAMSVICVTAPLMFFSFAKFDYRIGIYSTVVWGMMSAVYIIKNVLKQ